MLCIEEKLKEWCQSWTLTIVWWRCSRKKIPWQMTNVKERFRSFILWFWDVCWTYPNKNQISPNLTHMILWLGILKLILRRFFTCRWNEVPSMDGDQNKIWKKFLWLIKISFGMNRNISKLELPFGTVICIYAMRWKRIQYFAILKSCTTISKQDCSF